MPARVGPSDSDLCRSVRRCNHNRRAGPYMPILPKGKLTQRRRILLPCLAGGNAKMCPQTLSQSHQKMMKAKNSAKNKDVGASKSFALRVAPPLPTCGAMEPTVDPSHPPLCVRETHAARPEVNFSCDLSYERRCTVGLGLSPPQCTDGLPAYFVRAAHADLADGSLPADASARHFSHSQWLLPLGFCMNPPQSLPSGCDCPQSGHARW